MIDPNMAQHLEEVAGRVAQRVRDVLEQQAPAAKANRAPKRKAAPQAAGENEVFPAMLCLCMPHGPRFLCMQRGAQIQSMQAEMQAGGQAREPICRAGMQKLHALYLSASLSLQLGTVLQEFFVYVKLQRQSEAIAKTCRHSTQGTILVQKIRTYNFWP